MAAKRFRVILGLLSAGLFVAALTAQTSAPGEQMSRNEMSRILGGTCFCDVTTYGVMNVCGFSGSGVCSPCGLASCADYCTSTSTNGVIGKINSMVHDEIYDCPLGTAFTCSYYSSDTTPGCLCAPIGLFPFVSCGSYSKPVGGC